MERDTPACALRSLIFVPRENGALRPVPAESLGGDRYRIVGVRPEAENWLFDTGQVVECERRREHGTERLVAVRATG